MLTLPTAPVGDVLSDTELCPTCQHPSAAHDAISARWCAATNLGIGHRDCLCSREVSSARVLRHY